jgi:hypothetical protein
LLDPQKLSGDFQKGCLAFVPQDQILNQITATIFVAHFNEEALEVNRRFGEKYLFLFSPSPARVRRAQDAPARRIERPSVGAFVVKSFPPPGLSIALRICHFVIS